MSAPPVPPHAWSVQSSVDSTAAVATLVVRGRLGSVGAGAFREALVAAHAPGRCLRLDLGHVDYISSAGLAVLQDCAARFHGDGGRLELACASESVRLALRLAGPIAHLERSDTP